MTTLREQLDHQMNLKNDAVDSYQRMKEQRDELLEALKDLVAYGPRPEVMAHVNAAIAKAEGR